MVKDRLLSSVVISVMVVHAIGFYFLFAKAPSFSFRKQRAQKVQVHHITLNPKSSTMLASTVQPKPKNISQVTPNKISLKKEINPKPNSYKPPVKSSEKKLVKSNCKPAKIHKKPVSNQKEALSSIKEQIQNLNVDSSSQLTLKLPDQMIQISEAPTTTNQVVDSPKTVDKWEEVFLEEDGLSLFEKTMIVNLQKNLILPEKGKMKIEVTLSKEGKLIDWKVLQTSSQKNLAYLTGKLPQLVFPSFTDDFIQYKQYTFILTLCGD